MRFFSYLFATLLTVAPASVYSQSRGCQHWRTVYDVGDCGVQHCPSYPLDKYKDGFDKNKAAWETWANETGNTEHCGGHCEAPEKFTPGCCDGHSWRMKCYAHRMKNVQRTGIPAPIGGFSRRDKRACDVKCDHGCIRADWHFAQCKPGGPEIPEILLPPDLQDPKPPPQFGHPHRPPR